MKSKPIYVETHIDADVDAVWEASQDPSLHSQWDLRFSSITYLPRKDGEPQLFTYERKVLPFLSYKAGGRAQVFRINSTAAVLLPFISGRINGILPLRKERDIGSTYLRTKARHF